MESLSSESKALKVKSLLAGYYADERTDQADLNLDRIDSEGPNE